VFHYQHMVVVGQTARVPFECDGCHRRAEAIVSVESAGFSRSSSREDPRAVQEATRRATAGLDTAVPRLAELARCPSCGTRSPAALTAARKRGVKLTVGALATVVAGIGIVAVFGGPWGSVLGGIAILFGVILAPFGFFIQRLSAAAADRSVRFELLTGDSGVESPNTAPRDGSHQF
jgi:hypothetical protein